jgi:predicted acetyltransferase
MSGEVEVRLAKLSERRLIDGLMQFYQYDFSELEPEGSGDFELGEEGRFQPYASLEHYWREEGRIPLLIRVGGKPAGFALINAHSHLGGAVERNMAEFFVARKHRRRRVATEAVRQILAAYPGRWEVAVLARNPNAQAFWPRAIAAAPNVSGLTRHEGDGQHWTGPIWSFVAARIGPESYSGSG